jgi:acyl-CoA dehydrogenase
MLILLSFVVCLAVCLVLATLPAPLWVWAAALLLLPLAADVGLLHARLAAPSINPIGLLGWLPAATVTALCIPSLRRRLLVAPTFHLMRRAWPRVSNTARQALEGGSVGFEAELFNGKPDWQKLRSLPPITLTQDEIAFLEGPTEELCRMTDDWQIRHQRKEIPDEVWNFMKSSGFFGLRIAKEFGGHGFSAQALSLILGKVVSRSPDTYAVLLAPNSLSLGELIEKSGTEAQKRYYLPRLARGEDIACLALTGPASGSDAAAMSDVGTVVRGADDTIGIRASWNKRYIGLAPKATLIGVAFRLIDPDNLLARGEDVGITVAIVPAAHRGVQIGRRHLPAGGAFPIGPTSGKDVLIPLTSVVGGEAMVGQGWRMIMDSVSASRAIAVPSCAAAVAKAVLRVSTAYGRIRRQFGSAIGLMEGLEEPIARMAETAYVSEAGRTVVAEMVVRGENPAVISALIKYQTTERLRRSINDAMDLHGGRSFFDGPANYLQSSYQLVPATITIDGANIVTRALIAFTQGALRSHPYVPRELSACQDENETRGLAEFEKAFLEHISFTVSNISGAFLHNITVGLFCPKPEKAADVAPWYRQLSRVSRNFALVADLTLLVLGRRIRTKQMLTGRLADALSELFLFACVLKRYEDDGNRSDDYHFVAYAAQNCLYRFQDAVRGTIDNFPVAWARLLMKAAVFPLGMPYRLAPDWLGHKVARLASEPGEVRDRLTRYIFVSRDPSEATGLLEVALQKAVETEEIKKKIDRAARQGLLRRYQVVDWIAEAVSKSIITQHEGDRLREVEALSARAVAVDDFDPDEVRPNYMTTGNNTLAVRNARDA